MIFHNEPLQASSFNAILEWDIKVFCFPPTAHLQTRTTHKLVLPPSHPGPTMIQVFPQTKVRKNSKVGFAQMNKNRNLQNRVGIQMSQIQMVKVKETTKKGRNRKSKAVDNKRDVNNGLVGILCRDSNPTTDPPRAKLLRRKNSDSFAWAPSQSRRRTKRKRDQRETEEVWRQKVRLGLRMQRLAATRYKWGFPGSDTISKKCPVITRPLFLKRRRGSM
jgi:hypothetical protein